MAIGIENYPNISPADADYPNGNIRDAASGVAPTPVNVLTNADIHQTFYKLLDLASITANGDPENVSNGYQYIDALRALVEAKIIGTKRSYSIGAGQGGYLAYYTLAASLPIVTLASTKQELTLGGANFYEFDLTTSPAHDVVTFGTDIAAGYVAYFFWDSGGGSFTITLNSTNTSGKPQIVKNGVASADTPFTPITDKTYMVVRRTNVWEIVE